MRFSFILYTQLDYFPPHFLLVRDSDMINYFSSLVHFTLLLGLPFPRVNLLSGVKKETVNETCTAGAGSLLLEFGILSRLLGDNTYEDLARRVNQKLWSLRNKDSGLLGSFKSEL